MNLVGEANFVISPPRSGLQWNTRIDHTLTSKDRFYVSLFRNAVETQSAPGPRGIPHQHLAAHGEWQHQLDPHDFADAVE